MISGGQGRYDPECSGMLVQTSADVLLLVVLGGSKGSGFSMSVNVRKVQTVPALEKIVAALRSAADQIEKDLRALSNPAN